MWNWPWPQGAQNAGPCSWVVATGSGLFVPYNSETVPSCEEPDLERSVVWQVCLGMLQTIGIRSARGSPNSKAVI